MAQIYGELIRAQLQSSATDLSPTATGLVYFNTSTGLKWYTGSGWKIAADLDSSQTLAGKTLDATCSINVSALPIVSLAKGGLGADASAWSGFLKISAGVASAASISASDLPIVTAAKGGLGADASAFTGVVKSSAGVFSASTIVDADVSASAAIVGTKISPAFGSQNISTTGSVSGTNVINAGYEEFTEIASPSTPAAGKIRVYAKTDGKMYQKDDAGNEKAIGSGSGSGGVNYLVDWYDATKAVGTVSTVAVGGNVTVSGSFPAVTSAWYADTTSGSAAIASSSDNTLRSTANYLTALSGVSTSGATFVQSPVFNIDGKDLGTALTVQFDVSGNTTDNDWDVVAVRYNSSGVYQELIPIAGNVSTMTGAPSAKLPLGVKQFNGFFITGSTASDVYAIRWRRRAGSAQIRLDSLTVGPNQVLQGSIQTDWQTVTIDSTYLVNGDGLTVSPTRNKVRWRQVGNTMQLYGTVGFTNAAAGTSSANLGLKIPNFSTLTIDSNVTDLGDVYGYGRQEAAQGSSTYTNGIEVRRESSTSISFTYNRYPATSQAWIKGTDIKDAAGFVYFVQFFASIPISQWQSNTQQAARAVEEYAYNTGAWDSDDSVSFAYGPQGQQITTSTNLTTQREKRVRFQTPILPTDKIEIEIQRNGNWVPAVGSVLTGDWPIYSFGFGASAIKANSVGIGWQPINGSTTDVLIIFGKYSSLYNGATGVEWSSSVSTSTIKWRVKKVSAGAAVGFPVGARNVIGDTTGTAVPAGYIGEKITASSGGITLSGIGTTYNAVTLTLTQGVWLVFGHLVMTPPGSSLTNAEVSISETSATTNGSSAVRTFANITTAGQYFNPSPVYIVNSSASKTMYLTIYANYTGAAPTVAASSANYLEAVRIA